MAGESQVLPKSEPDPTVITTEIIKKEITHLRELLEAQLQAEKDYCAEKFVGIDGRLGLIEKQREELKADTLRTTAEQKKDTKDAVDAALTAAKEQVVSQTESFDKAFTKSETSTTKQIEQLGTTFTTQISALADKAADLNDRLRTMESSKQGGKEATAAMYALAGFIVSVLVIGGLVLGAR